MKMRRSPQTTKVLAEFLRDAEAWRYGYDLSRATGLASGTLYPILMRLAERSMLETSWEAAPDVAGAGRPPRHMYRMTHEGLSYARDEVRAAEAETEARGIPIQAPAFAVGQ